MLKFGYAVLRWADLDINMYTHRIEGYIHELADQLAGYDYLRKIELRLKKKKYC